MAALLKIKRGVYTGVSVEICNAFKDASIDDIRKNHDMILMNDESNSGQIVVHDINKDLEVIND